ncbi:NrdR-like transcriptional repressor [Candidatus Cyrtobacter comes]|uniref:Transcriptional repressor NrdR n=1 Tax=Candidatus Cyrtobacter comes TaxID=675776 RepID=A0ABU5L947_9RICK|nr:transcriptional regulator NrdR [Candidatus Cyrtobacter comes]MDZ5762562.1 NrdR-like transcriptional repressor [Candidatus Cyrtobacter comes]
MKCPFCENKETLVKDSRHSEDGEIIKRRRYCSDCGSYFRTLEYLLIPEILVIKRNGSNVPFSIDKLLHSMKIAVRKRSVQHEVIEEAVLRISKIIRKENKVTSNYIGALAMKELSSIDQVAYIRYASVYYDFNSIADFTSFIQKVSDE